MKHFRRAFALLLFIIIFAAGCGGSETLPNDPFFGNLTNASRVYRESGYIYYANPYEDLRLWRYDTQAGASEPLGDITNGAMFISGYKGYIYFAGRTGGPGSAHNIYRVKGLSEPELLLENASPLFASDGWLYYHETIDPYEYDICRYNLSTKKTEKLFDRSLLADEQNICLVGDRLYGAGAGRIYRYDLGEGALTEITEQPFENAINKLQYSGGYLYFYLFGGGEIRRYDIEKDEFETVLAMNDGDFSFGELIAADDFIYFSGRQRGAAVEGEEFFGGCFVYEFDTKEVRRIAESGAFGPECYVIDDKIFVLRASEYGHETPEIVIYDLNGSDISAEFPNLTSPPEYIAEG
ncbi:MAG: DUF5050 domain-containing protein [Eubacteriales bacterium]|jgi:hypothetical protein